MVLYTDLKVRIKPTYPFVHSTPDLGTFHPFGAPSTGALGVASAEFVAASVKNSA